jgi:hypothetical protein
MLIPSPAMTNAERQRLFQLRHPGYDRRRIARKRGAAKRGAAQLVAALQAKAAEASRPMLMLPAPAEDLVLVELNALAGSLASAPSPQPLSVKTN